MDSKLQQILRFISVITLILCIKNYSATAQILDIPYHMSIKGDIEVISFFKNTDGDTLMAGNYRGSWNDMNRMWMSAGENDLFLGKWMQGQFKVILSWGGSRNDVLFDAKNLANGDVILSGSFTERIQINQQIFTTKGNSKAIFMARINEKGDLLWISFFQGSSWQDWGQMHLDEVDNELILCGSFQDNITFDNGQILYGTGESSVFIGIFSLNTGKVKQLKAFSGSFPNNQMQAVSLFVREKSIGIAGNFDRDIVIDSLSVEASTRDWDVFFVNLRRDDLKAEKLLKFGGVYEQRLLTSFMDVKSGDIYLSGSLAGIMKIGESTTLQSQDGLSDIFLIKIAFGGNEYWATMLGGENVQAPLAVYKTDGNVWLSGYSLGKLRWQGAQTETFSSFHSFISTWTSEDGKPQNILTFSGDGTAFPSQFRQFDGHSLLFSGAYRGKVSIANVNLPFSSNYSGFLGFIPLTVTRLTEKWKFPPFNLFPNPGDGRFYLNGFTENGEVSVWFGEKNVFRGIVNKGDNFFSLPFSLPKGTYLVVVTLVDGSTQTKIYLKI
jgi:hypothetical protein